MTSLGGLDVHGLNAARRSGEVTVLDVRQPAEWAEGHIEDAHFMTGAELPDRWSELPDDRPLAVVCGSGYRSSVAASLLARHGRRVFTVPGGMSAWRAAGYPTVVGSSS